MNKHLDIENRIIDYALCFLAANWAEDTEDDLGISQEKLHDVIHKIQKNLKPKL
jgi:hypothetical protein